MAAGIVAASMARRCQSNLNKTDAVFVPSPAETPAKDGGGLFAARSRKELARRAKGGHERRRVPHRPLLRPRRHERRRSLRSSTPARKTTLARNTPPARKKAPGTAHRHASTSAEPPCSRRTDAQGQPRSQRHRPWVR